MITKIDFKESRDGPDMIFGRISDSPAIRRPETGYPAGWLELHNRLAGFPAKSISGAEYPDRA